MKVLLLDIGNSRLKWRWLVAGELHGGGELLHGSELALAVLDEAWADMPRPGAIWSVNVASPSLDRQLETWCQAHWQLMPQHIAAGEFACGVHSGYRNPQQLGVDRWLAMLGAFHLFAGACCIADCGTAVTVDCIDQRGQHQGGVILPGMELMPRCVVENTARVRADAVLSATGWLGNDTASCLELGASIAIIATLEHVSKRFAAQLAVPLKRVITGGDAQRLLPLLEDDWCYEAELVFIGMAQLINEVSG